jgi:hypothetical protein
MYGRRAFPLGTLLRVSEWKRDELGRVTGLHPHQHGVLAGLGQVRDLLADIGRIGHCLAADIEDEAVGVTPIDANCLRWLPRNLGLVGRCIRLLTFDETLVSVNLHSILGLRRHSS